MIAAAGRGLRGDDWILIVVIVVLIFVSGILALAETALTRTSKAKAKTLAEEGRRGGAKLASLVEHPQKFLNPVLLLVLICQLVSATLVGVVAAHIFGAVGVAVATVFEIFVIFVIAEALPKNWAVHRTERAALFSAPIISAVIGIPPIRWLSSVLIKVSNLIIPIDGRRGYALVSEEELLAMADVAVEEEAIEKEERALIHSIFEFGDSVVREVMTPRPDMLAVEGSARVGDVIQVAMAAGYSRIPVYDNGIDDIVGVVFTKDLVRAEWDGKVDVEVREVARKAHFVPETKKLASLMREMQGEKFHLAIVVDEYGGTAGLVTLEDLIEEIIGEIVDEFDVDQKMIEPMLNGDYRVDARAPIDEVNERLGSELPTGDWDSVGGLILSQLGHIPVEGEDIVVDSYKLVADRVKGRRISRVRISKIELPESSEENGTNGTGARESQETSSRD